MSDRRLDTIRDLIRRDEWDVTDHVLLDYLEPGEFSLDDIEISILTGQITKRERDDLHQAICGYKYTISGRTASGRPFKTVGKIVESEDGRMYLVITGVKNG